MRATASFGALVAGSLLQYATVQAADAGSLDSANDPQSYGNVPQDNSQATGASVPGGPLGDQACAIQTTSTIFVTVYPTTETIQLSPVGSIQATHTAVSIYTTVTVDVWGSGSDPMQHSGTIVSGSDSHFTSVDASSNEMPDYGSGVDAPGASSPLTFATDGSNGSPMVTTNAVGPTPAPTITNFGNEGNHGSSVWYTVVTDTDVHWTAGVTGPNPVTILSEHTIFYPNPLGGSHDGASVTCITTTGPDGRDTIIEWPVGAPTGNANSVTVGIPVGNAPPGSQVTSTAVGAPWPAITVSNVANTITATTYTIIGANGLPTVVQSSWYMPQIPVTAASGFSLPAGASPSGQIPVIPGGEAVTTSMVYTFVGSDGRPTVIESTWILPGPAATHAHSEPGPVQATAVPGLQVPIPGFSILPTTYTVIGANGLPSVVDTTFLVPPPFTHATNAPGAVVTGVPTQVTGVPRDMEGITTCITYTAIGPDGRPTAVETTVVMPASHGIPSDGPSFPSPVSPQQTNVPQGISIGSPVTTLVSIDVVGANGVATPITGTIVLTPAFGPSTSLPLATTIAFPSMAPQRPQTGLPQGVVTSVASNPAITTCLTVDVVGPNGVITPFTQTVVLTPTALSVELPTGSPVGVPIVPGSGGSGAVGPGLGAYGTDAALPPVVVSGVDGHATAFPGAMTVTVVPGPNGSPVFSQIPIPTDGGAGVNIPLSYGSDKAPGDGYGWTPANPASYAASPQPIIADSNVQSSTWTNVIPELTTTYKLNFPMTTLTTLAARAPVYPRKRAFRRQASPLSSSAWNNSSSTVSPSPDETMAPIPPSSAGKGPAMCPQGGKIGNMTINFDNFKPGPLFNPSEDIWFSQGFLVAPPSSQSAQSYVPSSGGQLVEFVPPLLSQSNAQSTSDTAQVGLGPNSASPCFRFDFFQANLGCAAQMNEQWCEFEISAYTYDEASSSEKAIGWSETKRVPSCPTFPSGSCSLTPVQFEGYSNITSVLIKLRVGLELRAWWGDDFHFGWTDNGCDAANCRAGALPQRVKRESVESALKAGVWHWTPEGLQRLDDRYIWGSAN